jgi:glycosyltransferase involved in cell wall biosynthesis
MIKKKRFKKIAFIAGTLGTGGAERQLFYLLRNLKNSGYEPLVICLTKGEFWESKILDLGIKVIYAGENESRFLRLLTILRIIRSEKPKLIYSFHFYSNIYGGIAGRILNITVLGSIRSDGISEKSANGILSWFHYALPHSIIANSEHGKQNCFKIFFKKSLYVLNNAIDLKLFPLNEKPCNEPLKIIFVGSLVNVKRPWLFLEFIKLIYETGIDCRGEMYGDGILKDEIKGIIEDKYSAYSIVLHPSHSAIQDIYKTADCLAMVSQHEGTPNVILEAMASGVPVAVLQMEGIETIVTPNVSGLVESSLENLAQKTVPLLTSALSKENMIRAARLKIETDFSLLAQIENFEAILSKLK